ncbi:AAA family ATPase [Shewanella sp. OMA3-2]|uniref:AAA family ATPase n=1 Tax=Shewanella sp. OMA3-2 TaxID=2908650 RepID=UPI001F18BEDD|nr:AAA family ATPase [Shewanella sp. OMA3-2]UJF21538.1 AAA family ATPase [Shewanella sp. OMA3-2]
MSGLKVSIKNLKSIRDFSMEIPIEQGLHVIAGSNGIGKSTIMGLLAEPFRPSVLWTIFSNANHDSVVEYTYEGNTDLWTREGNLWKLQGKKNKAVRIDGFIEGSIIHGTRFTNSNVLELSEKVLEEHLVDADDFINENFNYILHGKKFYR